VRTWGMAEYSPMFFTVVWNITTSLVPLLPDSCGNNEAASAPDSGTGGEVSDLFTRGCSFVPIFERDYPIVWLAMQGVLALARKTRKAIPPAARQYFEGMGKTEQMRRWNNFRDLPVKLALPVQDRLLPGEGDGEGEAGTGRVSCDLAALLRDCAGVVD
jgi:hypothetical protein